MCGIVGLFAKSPGLEERLGVHLVAMLAQMSDRGPASVKARIQQTLDAFLSDEANSKISPIDPKQLHNDPRAMGP